MELSNNSRLVFVNLFVIVIDNNKRFSSDNCIPVVRWLGRYAMTYEYMTNYVFTEATCISMQIEINQSSVRLYNRNTRTRLSYERAGQEDYVKINTFNASDIKCVMRWNVLHVIRLLVMFVFYDNYITSKFEIVQLFYGQNV